MDKLDKLSTKIWREKKEDTFKNWPLAKIHIFCPTQMKLGKNGYFKSSLFSLSFMSMRQKN